MKCWKAETLTGSERLLSLPFFMASRDPMQRCKAGKG